MRPRDPGRLATIASAAIEVFGTKGFARAQMADVAAVAGVSVGSLYTYVSGKDALLLVSARHGFHLLGDPALPVTVPDREALLDELRVAVRDQVRVPALEAALATDSPLRPDEVAHVVGGVYDLLAATRRVADAFEMCARDAPDLAAVFYEDARGRLLDQLARLVEQRGGGRLTTPAPVVARAVLETVTWLARHRHHDPTLIIDEADARAAAVELASAVIAPVPSTDDAG